MSFSIPEAITDWDEKLAYCIAANEKLRLDHNAHGAEYREGTITEAEWEAYKAQVFEPLFFEIARETLTLRDNPPEANVSVTTLDGFSETGYEFEEGLSWVEQVGVTYAMLGRDDLTDEQKAWVQAALPAIPQEALDAITLSTQQLSQQQAFLVLKDGTKQPLTMEVESTSY
jgi:hypothetical protein